MAQSACDAILNAATTATNGPAGIVFGAINAKGEVLAKSASGVRTLGTEGKHNDMDTDSVFCIFSCTKAITGIAVMQLVEQGKLDLDAPVDALLPEVASAKIMDKDGNESDPKTKITLRMLLTHTSGFTYTFFSETVKSWAKGVPVEFAGTLEGVTQPLICEPNTQFNYSVGIDWAGVAVARVSNLPSLGAYCKKFIFDPLGLVDTAFHVLDHCKDRLVSLHQRDENGVLSVKEHYSMTTNKHEEDSFASGGGGAYSTVSEYLKILNVLINKGVAGNGVRILNASTVEEMFKDQISHLPGELDKKIDVAMPELSYGPVAMMPGIDKGWGLTFLITKDPLPTGRSPGSVWWAGLANLYWMADPVKGTANFIMSQSLPFNDPLILGPWLACEAAVYAELNA